AAALALWARNPGERTFVSTDGEVVDKEGVVSGGALEGVGDGLLHKRREVQELADTVQELEARLQLATERVQQLGARVQATDTQVKRLLHEEREEELSHLRLERDVARLQEDLGRIAQRDQVLRHETEHLESAMGEVAREEQASREAIAAGEGEQSEREARLRALQADLSRAQERLRGGDEEVRTAREEARAVGERRGKSELALQGTRLEINHLEQQVRERHLMELTDVAAAKKDAALQLDVTVADEQMHSLRE